LEDPVAHTRRAIVTGLAAALPALATAATARATSQDDPIFAVLARHRAARAALETIDEVAEPARYAAAEQELAASFDALRAIPPTSLLGCQALVNFMIEDGADGVEDGECLVILRSSLAQLGT
jgi:hypothetical protein